MEDALSFAPEVPVGVEISETPNKKPPLGVALGNSWIQDADLGIDFPVTTQQSKFSSVYANPPIDEDWWKSVAPAQGRIVQMQAQANATPFTFAMPVGGITGQEFIDRLNDHTFTIEEQKHINTWRFAPYILGGLFLWSLVFAYYFITRGNALYFPFFLFLFWHPKLVGMGFNSWPRKKIWDELNGRLEKIIWPIEQRRNRLQNLKSRLPQSKNLNHQTRGDFPGGLSEAGSGGTCDGE